MATSRVLGVAFAALLAGALTTEAQQVSQKSNRDRKLITAEEIEQAQVSNAYQVVERLHPEFLRRVSRPQTLGGGAAARGSTGSRSGASGPGGSPTGGTGAAAGSVNGDPTQQPDEMFSQPETRTAAVFMDGTEMGGVEELQRIQSNLVEEIRYLTGPDAQTKYGPRFSAGVIEVKLKNR